MSAVIHMLNDNKLTKANKQGSSDCTSLFFLFSGSLCILVYNKTTAPLLFRWEHLSGIAECDISVFCRNNENNCCRFCDIISTCCHMAQEEQWINMTETNWDCDKQQTMFSSSVIWFSALIIRLKELWTECTKPAVLNQRALWLPQLFYL